MNKRMKLHIKWYIVASVLVVAMMIGIIIVTGKGKQPEVEETGEILPRETQAEEFPEIEIEGDEDNVDDTKSDEIDKTAETEEPAPENLKEGVEHSSVARLQERLMELGFMENDEPTRYYGPVTAASVKCFQRQNNLEQDGIAGPQTREMIMSPDAKYYAVFKGISGDDVKRIQDRLYELGYLLSADNVNGIFEERTEEAVIKLQEVNQLTADGKVGRRR